MTLNSSCLPSYGVVSLTGRDVDQRTGQERADAVDHDGQAALDLAGDQPWTRARLPAPARGRPGGEALGLVARQAGLAVAVFERLDGDGHEVADLDFHFAAIVAELLDGMKLSDFRPAFTTTMFLIDANDFGGDDFACTHLLTRRGFPRRGRQSCPFRTWGTGWL
jgi:hypothetical protein